jgi:hypothetical protein
LVEWTPTGTQIGPQSVTLVVSDTRGGSATQTFEIDVADVTPPVVALSMPTETLPGTSLTAHAFATDNVNVAAVRFEVNGVEPLELRSRPTPSPAPSSTSAPSPSTPPVTAPTLTRSSKWPPHPTRVRPRSR